MDSQYSKTSQFAAMTNRQLLEHLGDSARADNGSKKRNDEKIAAIIKQLKEKKVHLDYKNVAKYVIAKMGGVASGIRERQRLAIQELANRVAEPPANNIVVEPTTETPTEPACTCTPGTCECQEQ